jgi:hypothetical protein
VDYVNSVARGALLFFAVLLLFSGCVALSPQHRDLMQDDFGPYPANYDALINQWLQANLKDPYSVRDLVTSEPVQGKYWGGLLVTGGNVAAYRSCVQYNAKNSFGAYIGLRTYAFWMKNGRIINTVAGC